MAVGLLGEEDEKWNCGYGLLLYLRWLRSVSAE